MPVRDFKNQLAGQIGESLVVAELGRRNIIATSFAGNVPDIDLLAYRDGKTLHLQVKAWRRGSVSFDAKRFLRVELKGNLQEASIDTELDGSLIFVFVRIGEVSGSDEFYIIRQDELQRIIFLDYTSFLEKHGGIRPKNYETTHTAVMASRDFAHCRDNWRCIELALT